MVKGEKRITVPAHRSVTIGTLHSILHQAGISIQEFMDSR